MPPFLRPIAWTVLLGGGCGALAEDAPRTEAAAHAFLRGSVRFERVIFDGTEFPKATFFPPAAATDFLGPHEIKTRFFDRRHREVKEAAAPGLYGAVVELVPKQGASSRRLITLFRTAGSVESGSVLSKMSRKEAADWTGLPAEELERQAALVAAICGERSAFALGRDAEVARLFAGLALMPAGNSSPRMNADAFAEERQWWVDQKRRLLDFDNVYPAPLISPRHYHGRPAPVVRAGAARDAGMKPGAAEEIDAVLQAWAADADEPFSVCIVRRGVIVLHRAYGMRDGRPMEVTDPCRMSSITKAMSATLLMMLVDAGSVTLDDPASKHLPQFRGRRDGPEITIRHLYTHTSGLGDWSLWDGEAADFEDQLADVYRLVEAGKSWTYSAQGFILGGKVIEAVSGEALPRFYLRHLLDPLGLEHTDVTGSHNDARSVPLDMARFGQLLLNGGVYGDLEFFGRRTFEQMLPKRLTEILGPGTTRSCGIGLEGSPGTGEFGHPAATAATFRVERKKELVVVMCRNARGRNFAKHYDRFLEAIEAGIEGG